MYREFFLRSPLLALPIASLAIFMAVFAAVVWRVFRGDPKHFEMMARMSLDDGNKEQRS